MTTRDPSHRPTLAEIDAKAAATGVDLYPNGLRVLTSATGTAPTGSSSRHEGRALVLFRGVNGPARRTFESHALAQDFARTIPGARVVPVAKRGPSAGRVRPRYVQPTAPERGRNPEIP